MNNIKDWNYNILLVILIIILVLIYFIQIIVNKLEVRDTSISCVNQLYDLLQQITCEFDKTHTEYIMTGGTLLGAVRHGGLIPWDDDADVAVLNKSPKEILEILKPLKENDIISYEHIKGNIIIVKFRDSEVAIDIFFMKKSKNIMDDDEVYKYLFPFNFQYPNEWFKEDELYPLKDYRFGPLVLRGPNDYKNFLDRTYKDWYKVASKWNHNSIVKKDVETNIFDPILPDHNFEIRACKS